MKNINRATSDKKKNEFIEKLVLVQQETIDIGYESFEIVHEERDAELYFYKGHSGIGKIRNDLKDGLWELEQKNLGIIKSVLKCSSIKLDEYNHFGENARKLSISVQIV
ncbi:MAG: hypothetical protein JW866_09790 [Ignavibacteriales bacterium]|nr:hypothetical protein [Ignavibacteriales bacterium]